jgi:hypothetical protein
MIDLQKGEFRTLTKKLHALSKHTTTLLGRAACDARWLPT